ncbi:hypothetical protein GCM10011491_30480 [Brucella endophytica]|uniref:HTH cro/C1-type domain-containing protein n=1 Tax=Brucella endophytica TaxID=1963359 RepID=A0A916WI53_9HYPH|nr:helix-turn-helix transcriptional regulator [Brucella endophytica]GGB00120.1 hypothetical protein GCM10011491_30480 [Brucella endophytica]
MRKIDFYLRAILKETGWTQVQLAERLGTSQATVSRWFKGSEPEGHRRDAIVDLYNSVATVSKDNNKTRSSDPTSLEDELIEVFPKLSKKSREALLEMARRLRELEGDASDQ